MEGLWFVCTGLARNLSGSKPSPTTPCARATAAASPIMAIISSMVAALFWTPPMLAVVSEQSEKFGAPPACISSTSRR